MQLLISRFKVCETKTSQKCLQLYFIFIYQLSLLKVKVQLYIQSDTDLNLT